MRRTPAEEQQRIRALDEPADGGEPGETDHLETLRLLWPAYFGRREDAPPMPPVALGVECSAETNESLTAAMPALEAALVDIRVPVGFVTGERSPMPRTASTDAAARIPDAWTVSIPGVGHFPWIERPGCIRAPLERLRAQAG
jgi:proline iminopeptidase